MDRPTVFCPPPPPIWSSASHPNQAKGNSPWNLSFSWSQALQLPLLELCKKNPPGSDLPLEEMSALLEKELIIAGAAARGEYDFAPGQGDHN